MISATGLGSGLDVESIVSQLMALERRPLDLLQEKKSNFNAQLSAYGRLSSALSGFQSAMQDLSELDDFKKYQTTSSDEDIVTATASSSAAIGTIDIEIIRLAERHKFSSDEKLNTDTFGGGAGDQFTVQVGADVADSITVDLSTAKTLEEVRDAINENINNPGVIATLVNGNDNKQKLILTAEDSGEAKALSLSYGGAINASTFNFQTLNNIAGDLSKLDSEINIDGYNVTRASNTIADVLDGVTLNLEKANVGSKETLTITRDKDAVKESVQTFADSYNSLREIIEELRIGELQGDSTLQALERQLFGVVNTTPLTSGTYKHLVEVGLGIQKDGRMSVDISDLEKAIDTDFSSMAAIFATADQGYAARFDDLTDQWLKSGGLLANRTDGINSSVKTLDNRAEAMERRLEITELRYRQQYSALDTLMAEMLNTSNYLSQQLAGLNKTK